MFYRVAKCFLVLAPFCCIAFHSDAVFAQRPTPGTGPTNRTSSNTSPLEGGDPTIDIDVYVRGADGAPIDVTAVVCLVAPMGQVLSQGTTMGGNIQFKGVAASQYTIQVVAAGYENAVKEFDGYNAAASRVIIEMQPASNGKTGAGPPQILLAPKAQKELGKALEALRANRPADARSHLEAAYRLAPNHPAVNYLFGVYFLQMKDQEKAKSYWTKTLEFNPKHVSALLSLSEALMREQKLPDAESYVRRAVEADPNSWRAHAILADVLLKESNPNEAVKEADRALELGRAQAAIVQPLLARALVQGGNKERAAKILKEYVPDHPNDEAARQYLNSLQAAETPGKEAVIDTKAWTAPESEKAVSVPLPSRGLNAEVEAGEGASEGDFSPIDPRAQEALDRAFEVLRSNLTERGAEEARRYLDTAYRIAPTSAEVNYLFGAYWLQKYDRGKAISHWRRGLDSYPKHHRMLLSLGQALLDENKPGEALPYLELAMKSEPLSWRAYALSADAYLRQGFADQAAKHAERALELGRGEAAVVQRHLAAALVKLGEKDKAIGILQSYVRDHPADRAAKRQLRLVEAQSVPGAADAASEEFLQPGAVTVVAPQPLPPSKWVPPDVDGNVPAVEPGATCALDKVLQNAGRRVQEFVKSVDRYTATELLEHESISKWGFADFIQTRKFDYVVAIDQYKPGFFSVTEYRNGLHSLSELPDGVATNGLPALVLVFHPNNTDNFEMTCEGLSRWNESSVWQVHFRQRPDRPNTIRDYRIGESGPHYPVALRGRAWIAADSYQIVRMETDLVASVPEIRLLTDHTIVEYGPVHFQKSDVEMWLPQSAELYCDWRGKRMHRRLSYSNYLLFSVDEKQHISEPKTKTESLLQN